MFTRRFVLSLVVCLAGCRRSKESELAEVLNVADEGTSQQLLRGFHPVEENGWRWTQREFAVALKPPRRASSTGATLTLKYSLPDTILARLKEATVSAKVDGIPLPPEKVNKPGLQEMRRDVPAEALSGKTGVTVEFSVAPFSPPSEVDRRELGIIVHSVGLVKKI